LQTEEQGNAQATNSEDQNQALERFFEKYVFPC